MLDRTVLAHGRPALGEAHPLLTRPRALAAPLVLAALVARRWEPLVATVSGLIAGSAEWVTEADARFGGLRSRLHLAAAQQSGFGLNFSLAAERHALNGPLRCRPGWCIAPVRDVAPGLWWLALPAAGQ